MKTNEKAFFKGLGISILIFIFIIFLAICCICSTCIYIMYALVYEGAPVVHEENTESYLEDYFEKKCNYKNIDVEVKNIPTARITYFTLNSGSPGSIFIDFEVANSKGFVIDRGKIYLTFEVGSGDIWEVVKINEIEEKDYICR